VSEIEVGLQVLPEFQVQVLIWTGDSDSNPEQSPYRNILLVVDDKIGKL
jgi:hypothetical protein